MFSKWFEPFITNGVSKPQFIGFGVIWLNYLHVRMKVLDFSDDTHQTNYFIWSLFFPLSKLGMDLVIDLFNIAALLIRWNRSFQTHFCWLQGLITNFRIVNSHFRNKQNLIWMLGLGRHLRTWRKIFWVLHFSTDARLRGAFLRTLSGPNSKIFLYTWTQYCKVSRISWWIMYLMSMFCVLLIYT